MINLRSVAAFLAAGCLVTPGLAQPRAALAAKIDPEALSLANEIVALAYPPERRQALFMGAMDALMAQTRVAITEADGGPLDPGAEAILDRFTAKARAALEPIMAGESRELFAAFARSYARMFSRDELLQIRAFVATPVGARYLQNSPDTLADPEIAKINIAHLARVRVAIEPLQAEARQALMEHYGIKQR